MYFLNQCQESIQFSKMKVNKDSVGNTCIKLSENIKIHYDPISSSYTLEDFRASNEVLRTVIPDDILDLLYNKAWDN